MPMFENRVAQPAIVGATLAMWEALRRRVPAPAMVAGYSVGELSAYGVAGALEPARRGAAGGHPRAPDGCRSRGVVTASAGRNQRRCRSRTCARWRRAAGFEIAIVTGQDSCIAGGLASTLASLESQVVGAGGRLQRLPVGIASHTSLMAPAVAPFAEALLAAPFHAQVCPVLSGIGAERITDKPRAVETLSRQLSETIVWSECMDAAAEAGMTVALELGPGAALARMLQARHPQIACRSVADFRSLDGIVAWLGRHIDRMPVA